MQKKVFRICAIIMALSGIVILFSSIYPILYYEWESAKRYPIIISPLVDEGTASFKFSNKDYTKPDVWFPNAKFSEGGIEENSIRNYTISIPKLKIENAIVTIGGNDLSKSLIQFPGTATPGDTGNTVIFGHSILPIFYNPNNYLAIFSTLNKLEKNDKLYVFYDDISYEYNVENIFEVYPDDIQILEQNTNNSYVSLVTCTPPGDPRKPKRLIVRLRLSPFTN